MPSSEDQHRLNARQRREIDSIGQKCYFNLAPPPSSLAKITTRPTFVSLTEFIEQFDWQYSDLDIVDRREIKNLAETFLRFCLLGHSVHPSPHIDDLQTRLSSFTFQFRISGSSACPLKYVFPSISKVTATSGWSSQSVMSSA